LEAVWALEPLMVDAQDEAAKDSVVDLDQVGTVSLWNSLLEFSMQGGSLCVKACMSGPVQGLLGWPPLQPRHCLITHEALRGRGAGGDEEEEEDMEHTMAISRAFYCDPCEAMARLGLVQRLARLLGDAERMPAECLQGVLRVLTCMARRSPELADQVRITAATSVTDMVLLKAHVVSRTTPSLALA
jgi:hypothetical protein